MKKNTLRSAAGLTVATFITLSATTVPAQAGIDLTVGAESSVELLLPAVQPVREPRLTASTSATAGIGGLTSGDQGGSVNGQITFENVLISS